jgi:crotonobetainyl-CoA:carnitine CoA-transferase CaiB-like acyl-CoA transferase
MFECRDGYVSFLPGAGRNLPDLLVALDIDPELLPAELRGDQRPRDKVREFVAEQLKKVSARTAYHALSELLIATGLAMGPADLLSDPHLEARRYFFEVEHPTLGPLKYAGQSTKLSATPMLPPEPAPRLASVAPPPSRYGRSRRQQRSAPRRHPHPRPDPRLERSLRHLPPRPARRRRDQDRGAEASR